MLLYSEQSDEYTKEFARYQRKSHNWAFAKKIIEKNAELEELQVDQGVFIPGKRTQMRIPKEYNFSCCRCIWFENLGSIDVFIFGSTPPKSNPGILREIQCFRTYKQACQV